MNKIDPMLGFKMLARLRYMANEYQILSSGDHVRCAVTGQPIALSALRYWNAELQEPYANARIALERHLTLERARGKPARSQ